MKNYNTTDLSPEKAFERHVFHRDMFAHFLRRSYILKETQNKEEVICDFGCWKWNLLEVLYRNRHKCKNYIWIDIRKNTIESANKNFSWVERANFICEDLVLNTWNTDFWAIKADKVVSFEVLEHVWKSNADKFLENMINCWNENATYYISTPNYDKNVWAAWNHTYDCWDWKWVIEQEFTHDELTELFNKYFIIENKFGTFASIRDYKELMNEQQLYMFDKLREYYDTNLISVLFAPMFPEQSRNTLWVMKKK